MSSSSTSTPLLRPRSTPRPPSPLSLLLTRATTTAQRRGGATASMVVRETAARELEERRADWGYSKPVVALDIMWNFSFVIVSLVFLIFLTRHENPNVPVRVWVSGYAFQCLLHVLLVWIEYKRRRRIIGRNNNNMVMDDDEEDNSNQSSVVKRCESLNTMASFMWWIIGFYWVISGGEVLLANAPRLYWLVVIFLAFDVFFAIFCVVLACLIGIALCCCLPCIIAILYAIAGQEGASEADLSTLPKYKFQSCQNGDTIAFGAGKMIPSVPTSGYLATERILLPEDAECCICLCPYEDGAELNALPCNHHFHSMCIVKWLKMNATCPLCKYNILKGNDHV